VIGDSPVAGPTAAAAEVVATAAAAGRERNGHEILARKKDGEHEALATGHVMSCAENPKKEVEELKASVVDY